MSWQGQMDWDRSRRGLAWFAEQGTKAEEEFELVQAAMARVAPSDREGINAQLANGRKVVERLEQLGVTLDAEVADMWAFYEQAKAQIARKPSLLILSFLDPGAHDSYRHQFEIEAIGYQQIREAITFTGSEWSKWLAQLGEPEVGADGMVMCAAGHSNNAERTACLMCGLSLL